MKAGSACWKQQEASSCYRLVPLVEQKSDWSAGNVTGRRFVQSPSKFTFSEIFFGLFPRRTSGIDPRDLRNTALGVWVIKDELYRHDSPTKERNVFITALCLHILRGRSFWPELVISLIKQRVLLLQNIFFLPPV